MPGYWRDLGEPHKYLKSHRDVLVDDQGVLDDPQWPILTRQPQRVPARVLDGGSVVDSLLSPGCRVSGEVVRSVLGPGVVVAAGSVVRDSVVFAETAIEQDARVDWAIIDRDCVLGSGSVTGAPATDVDDPDLVVLVGRGSRVGAGTQLPAGARLEPGSTA